MSYIHLSVLLKYEDILYFTVWGDRIPLYMYLIGSLDKALNLKALAAERGSMSIRISP